MRGPGLVAALGAALLGFPATAAGEGGADPRDDAFFGGGDPRDDAFFGGGDARDDAFFGGGDARDDEFFGGGDSRDDEFFGGGSVVPASTRGGGDGLLSSAELDRRLGLAGSRLDIGGLLYLRAQYTGPEGTPVERDPVTSPNLLDLYLDARPSDRLRAFARGRLTHTFAGEAAPGGGSNDAALDQLWVKFDVERRLYVTAGRQPIRWGASRFWNPTDFMNDRVRDPLAVFDERLGVSLIKLHLPLEASGWNLYAIGNLEDASTVQDLGAGLRVEKLIGATEVSLSTAIRKDEPLRLGADLSFPLWDFDVRVEVAALYDDQRPRWRGPLDLSSLEDPERPLAERLAGVRLPEAVDRSDEWIPQVVLGADIAILYSDEDSLVLGAEYFYNGAGTADPALYPWLLANGIPPLYLGRHYGAFYATAAGPGSWNDTTLIASLLGNLDDRSFLGRFDWRVRLLTYLDVNAFAAWHFGGPGEFRMAARVPQVAEVAALSPEQQAQLGLPQGMAQLLATGIDRPAPRLELGAGLQLRF